MIWALKHFEVSVSSGVSPVVLYTDHNPLGFALFTEVSKPSVDEVDLQAQCLDVRHIKGRDHIVAGVLSGASVR